MQKSDETTGALSSTEMVERVSDAILNKLGPALNGGPSVTVRDVARAAIEAMREPTGDMLSAAVNVFSHFSDDGEYNINFTVSQAEELWPNMINAALGK